MRRKSFALAAAAVAVETAVVASRRGRLFAASTVVRCRRGHLFTTLWLPFGSLKAIRLGWWRFQRCPVGSHWSLVTPVRISGVSDEERRAAEGRRDSRVP